MAGKGGTSGNDFYGNVTGGNWSPFGMGGKPGGFGKNDVVFNSLDSANPWLQTDIKKKQAKKDAESAANSLYEQTGPLNQRLDQADTSYKSGYDSAKGTYKSSRDDALNQFMQRSEILRNEASDQGSNAQKTYTNDIQPRMKANMESAMTLKDAGDPNNSIQTSVRDMYNKQGQAANRQGQQDFGVLSALGAQAAGQQFGAGGPMTSGMQGQIYAANQGQAGNAYAAAQQRMHNLQQQGIDRGFDESNRQYERGQTATRDFIGAEGEYMNRSRDTRNELSGYDADRLGIQAGRASENMDLDMMGQGIGRDNAYGSTGRQQNALNQKYGAQQQIINNDLAASMANNASKGQFYGTIAGAAIGGVGGAAAGSAASRQSSRTGANGGYGARNQGDQYRGYA